MKKASPTLNDVHIPGTSGSSQRVSKPWTVSDPPPPAKSWSDNEKRKCVAAANASLEAGNSEREAIFACIRAAGRSTRKAVSDIDLTPPEGVRNAAKRGLKLRQEFKRGGTAVGVARARDLMNGKELSPKTIGRMVSYFARHEVDRKADGWGNRSNPSAGWIAWLLWGGDPGRRWAEAKWKQIKRERGETVKDKLYKVNGIEVTLGEMAIAWLEKVGQESKPVERGEGMIEKAWEVEILKASEEGEKRLILGAILVPEARDSQGDVVSKEEIEIAAHNFMINIHSRQADMDLEHKALVSRDRALPVESYLAPTDLSINGHEIPEGTWMMTTKVFDNGLWQAIKKGEISAYSIRGLGQREPVK